MCGILRGAIAAVTWEVTPMMTAGMVCSRRSTGAMLFKRGATGAAAPFKRSRAPAGTAPLTSPRGPSVKAPMLRGAVRGAARETAAVAKVAKKEKERITIERERGDFRKTGERLSEGARDERKREIVNVENLLNR